MVRRRMAMYALLAVPLTGCHPTADNLHAQTASFIPPGSRIIEARDDACREYLGTYLTCRYVRWQHAQPVAEDAPSVIESARGRGWRVARQQIYPQRRYITFERSQWRVNVALLSRDVYRPTTPCPALTTSADGSDFATSCSQSVYAMWTGSDFFGDLELGLLIGAIFGAAAGLLIRRASAFLALVPITLAYPVVATGVFSPGVRLSGWGAQLLVVDAVAAAACALGIFFGRLPGLVRTARGRP